MTEKCQTSVMFAVRAQVTRLDFQMFRARKTNYKQLRNATAKHAKVAEASTLARLAVAS